MSTGTSANRRTDPATGPAGRGTKARALRATQERATRRRRLATWVAVVLTVVGIVTAMLLTSRPVERDEATAAPDFTLTDTSGREVSLADFRGENVLLYFNEGAGCDSCFYQMAEIEQQRAAFEAAGVTVLPVAANPTADLRPHLQRFGLTTPWLVDADVAVSTAYGTVGKGMHAGLPGHSFVLVDAQGKRRWYGEYPTMYLPAQELLAEVTSRLP